MNIVIIMMMIMMMIIIVIITIPVAKLDLSSSISSDLFALIIRYAFFKL